MNPVRAELETRLKAFADSYSTPLQVCYENVPFVKPTGVAYLECFLMSSTNTVVSVDGTRSRERGVFQVNVWTPIGVGSGQGDDIVAALKAYFPVIPKTGIVSIEQPPNDSRAILDISPWRIIPVTINYRVEH